METIKLKLTGITPLLMHNGDLANPMGEGAKRMKKLTGNRKKTDDIYEELSDLEFQYGLYFDEKLGPYIPGECLDAALFNGAKMNKLGTTVQRGAQVIDDMCPLIYKGPRDFNGLAADNKYRLLKPVRVSQKKVLRTRPMFREWALEFTWAYMPDQFDAETLVSIAETTGRLVGLCDWRPRYGKFSVERIG